MLERTTPHFVRCVKPNFELMPDKLDGANVMRQLREMGMVHVRGSHSARTPHTA